MVFTSFSELLEEIYPKAVELGIPSTQFWSMTFEELMVQVRANVNVKTHEARDTANHNYILANLLAYSVNEPSKIPKAENVYPILKEENTQITSDNNVAIKEEPIPQWKIDQINLMEQARRIKATRERKGIE